MLYCRDERTGDHIVSHDGVEERFASRAEAMELARRLADECAAKHDEDED